MFRLQGRSRSQLRGDRGDAIAEFVMVVGLLTILTLSVIQLTLALHIRNTVMDAAAEGARFAALADTAPADGEQRTRDLITAAIGESYAGDVHAVRDDYLGRPAIAVTVRTPLPLIGLVGIESGLEVTGHAALENLE